MNTEEKKQKFLATFAITGLIVVLTIIVGFSVSNFSNIVRVSISPSDTSAATSTPTTTKNTFHLAVIPAFIPTFNSTGAYINVFDTLTNRIVRQFTVNQKPDYVAMSQDGRYAYLAQARPNSLTPNTSLIYKLDLQSLSISNTLGIPTPAPHQIYDLEISPDGKWLGVLDIQLGTIHLVNTQTLTIVRTVVLCPTCSGSTTGGTWDQDLLVFSPDSRYLYVAKRGQATVVVLDISNFTTISTFPSLGYPFYTLRDMKLSPDQRYLYVLANGFDLSHPSTIRRYDLTNSGNFQDFYPPPSMSDGRVTTVGDMEIIQVANGTSYLVTQGNTVYAPGFIDALNLNTLQWIRIPSLASGNSFFTYNKSTHDLYSTCETSPIPTSTNCIPSRVSMVNMDTLSETAVIDIPGFPLGFSFKFPSFSQDGRYYYQPMDSNNVVVIDATSKTVTGSINTGLPPRGVYMQGDSSPKEFY